MIHEKIQQNLIDSNNKLEWWTNENVRKRKRITGYIGQKKSKSLLSLVDDMHKAILKSDIKSFANIINEGWKKKKESNPLTIKNTTVAGIDNVLNSNKEILAHKLCGAGNGGFFLVITKSGYDTSRIILNRNITPISISNTGVRCHEV